MRAQWALGLVMFVAGQALAQTSFFTVYPGHPSFSPLPRQPTTAAAIEIEYPVAINARSLVLNQSVRASWAVRMPDGSAKTFQNRSFNGSEGFIPYGDYDVQPDPNLPDSALSWDWFGVAGRESLTVSVYRGRISGTLIAADKNYAVAESQGQVVFRRIEPSLIPLDVMGSHPPSSKKFPLPDVSHAKFNDPIDVLIVHTPAAVTAAGSRAQLNALIAEAFNQANSVISNSGIVSYSVRNVLDGQANLSTEVAYGENGTPPAECNVALYGAGICRWVAHRVWVRTNATVQSLRNSTNADMVVMFVADQAAATGVAYVQRDNCGVDNDLENTPGCTIGAGYNNFAVSVVSTPWATAFQVFAHETGHQLGMEHNVASASPNPSYPWSHGWFAENQNETVMSIAGAVGACNNCPRSLQYSNPNVAFINSAVPSGTAGGAWNARTAAALAPAVSDFRAPKLTFTIFRSSFEALPIP